MTNTHKHTAGLKLVDLDERIQAFIGCTVKELVDKSGWPGEWVYSAKTDRQRGRQLSRVRAKTGNHTICTVLQRFFSLHYHSWFAYHLSVFLGGPVLCSPAFRQAELHVFREVVEKCPEGHLVVCGGGLIETPDALALLQKQPVVVQIDRHIDDVEAFLLDKAKESAHRPALADMPRFVCSCCSVGSRETLLLCSCLLLFKCLVL